MAIAYSAFRRHWHFASDPLQAIVAEQERSELPALYHPHAWFSELVGNPRDPRSGLIFGGPGRGKTATRLELGRRAGSMRDASALVLTIDDSAALLARTATPEAYVALICELTLLRLDAYLRERSGPLMRLREADTKSYDLLWLYWDEFAQGGCFGRPRPSDEAELLRRQVRQAVGPRDALRALAELVRRLEFASVYVLFDALDEGLSESELARLIEHMRPLLSNRGLLNDCGYAFYFFLPLALRARLEEQQLLQPEHLRAFTIEYSAAELLALLNKRLRVHSRYSVTNELGYVERFAVLCAERGPDAELALAHAAQGSPRQLLRLLKLIIDLHCQQAEQETQLIALSSVEAVIGPVPRTAAAALAPPDALAQLDLEAPMVEFDAQADNAPVAAAQLLMLHPDGRITIGAQPVRGVTGKLYQLLEILWKRRGTLVPYAEIERELYKDDLENRERPQDSRYRLVVRLREKLEPYNPNNRRSRLYIDVIDGVGLRLKHVPQANQGEA